jgi:hypothetical protein
MSLGSNHETCTGELVEAMRARLDTEDPPAGENVDKPQVRKNFEALGEAVHQILTVRAETISQAPQDASFWAWIAAVTGYLAALGSWQQGVRQAVQAWTPADAPGQQLKAAILALPVPGAAPGPAPTGLTGKLR